MRAAQVVVSLYEDDQIPPYLVTMPTEVGEFKRLFLQLGATLTATAPQYAGVLDSMYLYTGGEKLHPNELRLAFRWTQILMSLLLYASTASALFIAHHEEHPACKVAVYSSA